MSTKTFILSFALLCVATPALAAPNTASLPQNAVEVSKGVFSLGRAYDLASNSFVEGYAVVHKKSSPARGGTGSGNSAPKCYGIMASGAKWKDAEGWYTFGANSGMSEDFVLNSTSANIMTWESAAKSNIMGTGSVGIGTPSNPYVLDTKNEISFGLLDDPNTIAVTVTWGIFSGPILERRLVEWDQVFNTNYGWSGSGESQKMDYANISTHELGHAMGLVDVYDNACSEATMYGYGVNGETKKVTLEKADITGINLLY